jgi:hypothetical protein
MSFLVLSAALSSTAFAAEEAVTVAPVPTNVVYEGSSEFNRMNKTALAAVQVLGVGPLPVAAQGLIGGYYLKRNSILQAEYTSGTTSNGLSGYGLDLKAQTYGVHLKQFLSNSFYLKLGVDYRTASYRYNYTSLTGSQYNENYSFTSRSWSGALAIGNQWQFENFTIGCDWIGYVAPFSSTVTDERYDSGVWQFQGTYIRSDRDRLTTSQIAQGLRFYLGASF